MKSYFKTVIFPIPCQISRDTEEQLYFRLGTPFSPLLECTFSQKIFNYASNFTRHVPGCLTGSAVPANIKAV